MQIKKSFETKYNLLPAIINPAACHSQKILLGMLIFAVMGQKKLKRFSEIKTFSNVLEYPEKIAGEWNEYFNNNHQIILELACGKGEYAVGLAKLYPDKNFIGVDIKGNRIWVGAKFSLENNITNVAFLRTQIHKIDTYFSKNEVAEIWITFPDPQLRISKANKRLTHPRYLRLYQQFLTPGGKIHLKTDSPDLYDFTKTAIELYGLNLITDIKNIPDQKKISPELMIKTHYENLDIAKSNCIFYLCFSLPEEIINADDELEHILKSAANE
ncbi:MAG: tRNA (guanosine(46)-N7)-methyltransferase TrmB [Ginsengibacter sp.]